jgi:hypothetical protein
MADEEAVRKYDLLATAMHVYFWNTGADLTARWKEAMLGLPPSVLRELAGRLQELEAVTNETNRFRGYGDALGEVGAFFASLSRRQLQSSGILKILPTENFSYYRAESKAKAKHKCFRGTAGRGDSEDKPSDSEAPCQRAAER